MAGIGVRLNRIFSKNTITTNLIGFGYSMVITIAPMFLVIGAVIVMQKLLGYSKLDYASRELCSCTVLYIFIFALTTAAPFNAVLSRYLSDVIYNETYDDILPCYFVGLMLNILLSSLIGIPFCIREYLLGVELFFVFISYCGYVSLVLVFYSMLYLSICKDYKKISTFFLIGMVVAILFSLVLVKLFRVDVIYSMVVSLAVGFMVIGCLELALVKSYFRHNSGKYRDVLEYFKRHWQLTITNTLYTVGMYVHNFVFWSTDMRMEVKGGFICMPTYDMATCLAMFTNITASMIFISRVEMHFHERYKAYSEAVIGGRGSDIEDAKKMMFGQLSEELMNLARLQFIVSVVIFFICIILLPKIGFGGQIMRIYPCLAAGYFILFIMYAAIIFQYYFNDMTGAMMTSLTFFGVTFVGSIYASRLSPLWFGLGVVAGSFAGWTVAYHRLRKMEKTLDVHIFCNGSILKRGKGKKPSNLVYVKGGISSGHEAGSLQKSRKKRQQQAAK
ncbi:MAG: exopolysaccharide Pel transporter PelG [Acetatifactor sp.]|nr:exopolysaccharide Pel transporter PelG [Acetatifactor sp.]